MSTFCGSISRVHELQVLMMYYIVLGYVLNFSAGQFFRWGHWKVGWVSGTLDMPIYSLSPLLGITLCTTMHARTHALTRDHRMDMASRLEVKYQDARRTDSIPEIKSGG